MNSCELVSFVTALACGIAKCSPKEELPLLVTMLTQLADTLATFLEAEDLNASKNNKTDEKLPGKGSSDNNTTADNISDSNSGSSEGISDSLKS